MVNVVEFEVPVTSFVSFACHPPDQFPYNVIFASIKSSLAEQLNTCVELLEWVLCKGETNVTSGSIIWSISKSPSTTLKSKVS